MISDIRPKAGLELTTTEARVKYLLANLFLSHTHNKNTEVMIKVIDRILVKGVLEKGNEYQLFNLETFNHHLDDTPLVYEIHL